MSADRAASILARFNAVHNSLMTRLRDSSPGSAERPPDADSWSAAQIACHVALTNEWIAGVLAGSTPAAEPAPDGFAESFSASALPSKLKTFSSLEPPGRPGRDAAIERLRASGQNMARAIAGLTPERGVGQVVKLPFGTLSLYELADFTAAHTSRHLAQLDRTLTRA